jgi:hypothetical protein
MTPLETRITMFFKVVLSLVFNPLKWGWLLVTLAHPLYSFQVLRFILTGNEELTKELPKSLVNIRGFKNFLTAYICRGSIFPDYHAIVVLGVVMEVQSDNCKFITVLNLTGNVVY